MQALAEFFKLFSDETRLRCINLIYQNQSLCVCELTYALELSQPKISRHLALLRQSGLIVDKRIGQWVYYSINPQLQEDLQNLLFHITTSLIHNQMAITDSKRLKEMKNRPQGLNCC